MNNNKNNIILSNEEIIFKKIALEWLSTKQLMVKSSTYNKYSYLLSNHILPQFGALEVSGYNIGRFESGLKSIAYSQERKLSRSTMKSILYIVKAIIKYGYRYGFNSNIDFEFDITDDKTYESAVLSPQEEDLLLKYLYENTSIRNLGIILSLTTGLRLGEICALKRKNINFDTNVIYICETVQRLQVNDSTQLVSTPPKSKKSYRYVPMPNIASSYLKKLQINTMDGESYILTDKAIPFEPRTLQYIFKSVLRKCEIPDINFHALRHTFATNCIELGFDIKTLSELLGHSSVAFTLNRYVHSSINHKIQQMGLLDSKYNNFS